MSKTAKRSAPKTKPAKKPAISNSSTTSERLNRYLARCGLCSRREADIWIAAGRVSINGKVVADLGRQVASGDKVSVDGNIVEKKHTQTYILYNKPRGVLCSRKDAQGRPLIYDKLDVGPSVQSIGRLDMDSEGLLLLTDDGELAQALTHPSSGIDRKYRVRLTGTLELHTLQSLRAGGVDMGNGDLSEPWNLTVDSETAGHTWISVTIRRGRWREIRRTLEGVGHTVRRLIRVQYGSLKLEDMPSNAWRTLKVKEIRNLRKLAGLSVTAT